jgi:hypothetical protein
MSSENGHGHAGGHHDDHHEAFDPEPVQELGADETPSPGWLPIAGGSLILVGAMWAFYPGAGAKPVAPVEAAPATSVAAPAVPAARATPAERKPARPAGSGSVPGNRKLMDVKSVKRPPAKPGPAPKP